MTFFDEFEEFLDTPITIGKIVSGFDKNTRDPTRNWETDYKAWGSKSRQLSARDVESGETDRLRKVWRYYCDIIDLDGKSITLKSGMVIVESHNFDYDEDDDTLYRIVRVYKPMSEHYELDVVVIEDAR